MGQWLPLEGVMWNVDTRLRENAGNGSDQLERGLQEAVELMHSLELRARRDASPGRLTRIRDLRRQMAEWEEDERLAGAVATRLEANGAQLLLLANAEQAAGDVALRLKADGEQLCRMAANMREVRHELMRLRVAVLREDIDELVAEETEGV
jgi:hypothetical protein